MCIPCVHTKHGLCDVCIPGFLAINTVYVYGKKSWHEMHTRNELHITDGPVPIPGPAVMCNNWYRAVRDVYYTVSAVERV